MPSRPAGEGLNSARNARLLARVRETLAGAYRIDGILGGGGMAVVFRAHNLNLDRAVAIKVMRPEKGYEEGMVDRFLTESKAIATLQHPNIISIHSSGSADEVLWFEMDLVEGGSLDQIIANGPVEPRQAARWLAGAADALAYAHRQGIVHRDIKPHNLLLSVDGEHVVVTDFGIAKLLGTSTLTETGMTVGTVAYMSPEQLATGRQLTPATDQYSLGVVAYEMVAGVRPFDAETPGQFAVAQATQPLPPLLRTARGCPRDLADLIHRMLAKNPEDRWSGLDLVADLAREIAMTGTARSLQGRRRRSRVGRLLMTSTTCAVGVALFFLFQASRHTFRSAGVPTQTTQSSLLSKSSALPPPVSAPAPPSPPPPPPPLRDEPRPASIAKVSGVKSGSQRPGSMAEAVLPPASDTVTQAAAVPTTANLLMTTRTPGTFVYLGAGATPIVLDPKAKQFTTVTLRPGPIQIRIRTNQPGCHDRTIVDTLVAGHDHHQQLDPDCPT